MSTATELTEGYLSQCSAAPWHNSALSDATLVRPFRPLKHPMGPVFQSGPERSASEPLSLPSKRTGAKGCVVSNSALVVLLTDLGTKGAQRNQGFEPRSARVHVCMDFAQLLGEIRLTQDFLQVQVAAKRAMRSGQKAAKAARRALTFNCKRSLLLCGPA